MLLNHGHSINSQLKERVQALYKGEDMDDWVVVLQHPPIYTLGTKSFVATF
jgi:lipoate-protein ligase B